MAVLFFYAEFMFFAPDHFRGSTIDFTASQGELITIEGVDKVSVSAESDSYFRIYSGEQRLLALPDSKDLFTAKSDQFPVKDWDIRDGVSIQITLESDNDAWFFVTKEVSTATIVIGSILCFLIAVLFWLAGYVIFE